MLPKKILISDLLRSFLVYSWGEIVKKLDDLLNLVAVFEARRIKCDSVSLVIRVSRKEREIALSF